MARDNRKSSGGKRPPPAVDLSPPKIKRQGPYEKRNLSPLPEVRGRTGNNVAPAGMRSSDRSAESKPRPDNMHLRPLPPPRTTNRNINRSRRPQRSMRRSRGLSPDILRVLSLVVGAVIVGVVVFVIGRNALAGNATAVYLGGVHRGYMRLCRESTSESFQNEVIFNLESRALTEVIISQEITIRPARFVANRNIRDRVDMINRISNYIEYQIIARAIYVDNRFEVLVRGDGCVAEIEQLIKERWRTPNTISAEFVSDWRIEHVAVDHAYEGLHRPLSAIGVMERMVDSTHPHTVQSGENLHIIAARFNTSADRIALANNMNSIHDIIHPGDTLQIPSSRPLLAVETVEEIIEVEEIPMPTQTVPNAEMAVSTTAVSQEGSPGELHVARLITSVNGIRVSEVELDAVVFREPVPHIVYEGTRPELIRR